MEDVALAISATSPNQIHQGCEGAELENNERGNNQIQEIVGDNAMKKKCINNFISANKGLIQHRHVTYVIQVFKPFLAQGLFIS